MPIEERRVRNDTVVERCKRESNRVSARPWDVIKSRDPEFKNVINIRKVRNDGRGWSNDNRHEGRNRGIVVIKVKML